MPVDQSENSAPLDQEASVTVSNVAAGVSDML